MSTEPETIPVAGRERRYYPSANLTAYRGSVRVDSLTESDCAELAVPAGSLLLATMSSSDEPHHLVVLDPDSLRSIARLVDRP